MFSFWLLLFVEFCLNRDFVCDIVRCTDDVLRESLATVEFSATQNEFADANSS